MSDMPPESKFANNAMKNLMEKTQNVEGHVDEEY
jgi:hypothetical protein